MPRSKKDPALCLAMGQRLKVLLNEKLHLTPDAFAAALGLKTRSSVTTALAGRGFLDPDRLVLLAGLRDAQGRSPNLHWLLTGEGSPLLEKEGVLGREKDRLHHWLNADRFEALRKLSETPLR